MPQEPCDLACSLWHDLWHLLPSDGQWTGMTRNDAAACLMAALHGWGISTWRRTTCSAPLLGWLHSRDGCNCSLETSVCAWPVQRAG